MQGLQFLFWAQNLVRIIDVENWMSKPNLPKTDPIPKPVLSRTARSDFQVVNNGSLLTDFSPPVNPPAEIDDPNDKKPSDWDEREKIQDPEATKPEDWDENAPKQLPDTSASKPDGKAIV